MDKISMAFCKSCNAQVEEHNKFCSNCGFFVGEGNVEEDVEVGEYFNNLKVNLNEAVEKLEKSHRNFDNKQFDSALKGTEDVESILKRSSNFLEQIRNGIAYASAQEAIGHSHSETILIQSKITAFEEEKMDADSRGVDVAGVNKILENVETNISEADRTLDSARAALNSGNVERVMVKTQKVLDILNTVSELLISCREELRLAGTRAIIRAQKSLGEASQEYQKASIYFNDTAKSGADVGELSLKINSCHDDLERASSAISNRRFNIAEAEAGSAMSKGRDVIEQSRLIKFDYLTKKAIESAMPRIRGGMAESYANLAEEARLNHRFSEAVVLLNKGLIATQIQSLQENIAELEDYQAKINLTLDLSMLMEGISRAQILLEGNEWKDSIDILSSTNKEFGEVSSTMNTYIEVKENLEKVKSLFFIGIRRDTSTIEKAQADAAELIQQGKYEDSESLLHEAKGKVEEYKIELEGKFKSIPILGFFKHISRRLQGTPEPCPLEKFEIKYEGIAEGDLITVELKEPEVKSYPNIKFQREPLPSSA